MAERRGRGGRNFVGAALDALSIGVWSWRDHPAKVRCCPVLARPLGVPAAAGRDGLSLERFAASVHPEDRERFGDLVAQARARGGPFVAEYRTIPARGVARGRRGRAWTRAHLDEGASGPAATKKARRGVRTGRAESWR